MATLGEMLNQVMAALASQVVADGEGARQLYRVEVRGADTAAEALKAARTVALSPLVKTAMAGADVNGGASWRPWAAPAPVSTPSSGNFLRRLPGGEKGEGLGPEPEPRPKRSSSAGPST